MKEFHLDRLIPDHRGIGVERADIVIEAIFEDVDVKRSLYGEIEPRMKPDAVLATNTSSIPLEELASALEHPERPAVRLHRRSRDRRPGGRDLVPPRGQPRPEHIL